MATHATRALHLGAPGSPLFVARLRAVLVAAGLLVGFAAPVAADGFETLRAQALELDWAASRIGEPAEAAADTLSVYVGARAQDVWLREVWLQIDNGPMHHHQYSQREAEALRGSGLHRLLTLRLTPGPHRIRAQAAAAAIDAQVNDLRRRAAVDQTVTQGEAPLELELSWAPGGVVQGSTLKLINWQRSADSPVAIEAQPRYRAVAFLDATGRGYQAQRLLRELQAEVPGTAAKELVIPDGPSPGTPGLYAAYNTLLAGNADLAAIDRLGAGSPCGDRPTLLCDHVNTELGYALLAQGEGVRAAEAFRRVRAPGPQASAALLGLGWALLAPATAAEAGKGGDQAGAATVLAGSRGRYEPRAMKDKERGDAMRAALVPWIELVGRDPSDPAVQEAQIAIAWVMSTLGAEVQAQDYYNRAITQLEALVKRCDKASAELARQSLSSAILGQAPDQAWHWALADRLPDPRWWVLPVAKDMESFYLIPLLQQAGFDTGLRQLRDAHEVQAALNSHRQRLLAVGDVPATELVARIDALLPAVASEISALAGALDSQALAQIAGTREQAQRSLVEARYGLVHLYDRAAEVASK